MKNNNFRKSGLAIAMAAAMGASTGASAAVELYNQDGTSFSVDGYFNAFYVNRDDKLNDERDSRIKMGFLPNTIGFNFSKEMGDLTLGGALPSGPRLTTAWMPRLTPPSTCGSSTPRSTAISARC